MPSAMGARTLHVAGKVKKFDGFPVFLPVTLLNDKFVNTILPWERQNKDTVLVSLDKGSSTAFDFNSTPVGGVTAKCQGWKR